MLRYTQFHHAINAENIVHVKIGLLLLSLACMASLYNEHGFYFLCQLLPLYSAKPCFF